MSTAQLTDRVAIVTGAAAGIGLAVAYALAGAGAHVVMADIDGRASTEAERLAGLFIPTDVRDPAQIQAAVAATMDHYGRLDVLINNAGVAPAIDLFDISVADWDEISKVNARGSFLFLQAAAKVMVAGKGGSIVNIASSAGKGHRTTSSVAYAMSKGAVITMTRTVAARLAGGNVRVNAICPGPTMTPLLQRWSQQSPEGFRAMTEAVPLGRINTPEQVANLALFLASDSADTITGQSWNIDGGLIND